MDMSLIDTYVTTFGVILIMALLSCLCCLCMKFSDLKMQRYIIETAEQKGIHIDVEKLDPKYSHRLMKDETCAIMVPDVTIIL